MIEYNDQAVIFFELKLGNAEMPYGQKIALKRIADNNQKAGKHCAILVCEHDVYDCNKDIKADLAIVRDFYYAGRWYKDGKRTAKQVLDSFITFCDKNPF